MGPADFANPQTMASLSFSSLVSSATNLSRSVSALAASTDAHLRQLDDEQTDAVDRIVQPPQRATFNSAAQRAEMHDPSRPADQAGLRGQRGR